MTPNVSNLFAQASSTEKMEEVHPLLEGGSFRLEGIHSYGQQSPEGFWYDQADDEWVILLQGTASLEFPGNEMLRLNPGDYLMISAHCRHRVAFVSRDAVWLALHAGHSVQSAQ